MIHLSPRLRVLGTFALRLVIATVLLYLVVQNWNQLAIDPSKFSIGLIMLSALLYPFSFGLIVAVWHQIMRLQIGSTDWRRDSRIYCYSNLVRSLPFGLFWRISGRTMLYLQANVSSASVIAASLWEIVLHAASAMVLLLPTLAIRAVAVSTWVWGFALALALIAVIVVLRRIRNRFVEENISIVNLCTVCQKRGKVLALILILNSVTWLNAALMLQLLVYAVAPQTAFDYINALQTWLVAGLVSYAIFLLPFLDVGTKEVTMAVVLSAHMPLPIGIVIAVLNRLIFTVSDLLCSLLTLLLVRQGRGKTAYQAIVQNPNPRNILIPMRYGIANEEYKATNDNSHSQETQE